MVTVFTDTPVNAALSQRKGGVLARLLVPAAMVALSACGGGGNDQAIQLPSAPPSEPLSAQVSCESLLGVKLTNGTVTAAQSIQAGDYTTAPGGGAGVKVGLPAFCRVVATMTPTTDSNINVEMWLPRENWNGRYLGTGNGGGAGQIAYDQGLAEGLKRGFAVANTDLGTSPNANNAVGHPEKWADFGYRGSHEMTTAAKQVISALYSAAPHRSYFQGCSTGGEQALAIAQRYPDDYDGIIAGAPANNRTHLHMSFAWMFKAISAPGAMLTPAQQTLVRNSTLAACVGKDGGAPTDNFLTDPRECTFDLNTIPVCAGAAASTCITPPQLDALKTIYGGPVNPRTGERIHAGLPLGFDTGLVYQLWDPALTQSSLPATQYYPFYWSLGQNFTTSQFDFDHDVDTVDARLAPLVNANNPNLSRFKSRGGKLLMFTGTDDPLVPFPGAIDYYERVISTQGSLASTQDFFRYYTVPGMSHCAGGVFGRALGVGHFGQPLSPYVPASSDRDMLLKMVDWVEDQIAPEEIVATQYAAGSTVTIPKVAAERPLCVYPKATVYQGGDATKLSSFVCQEKPRGNVQKPADRYLN